MSTSRNSKPGILKTPLLGNLISSFMTNFAKFFTSRKKKSNMSYPISYEHFTEEQEQMRFASKVPVVKIDSGESHEGDM